MDAQGGDHGARLVMNAILSQVLRTDKYPHDIQSVKRILNPGLR